MSNKEKDIATKDAGTIEPLVAGASYLTGYPVLYTPADITAWNAAVSPAVPRVATINDFKVGQNYQFLRRVGSAQIGTDTQTPPQPIYEDRYEAVNKIITANNINQDLFDFQMYLKRGNAFLGLTGFPAPTALQAQFGAHVVEEEEEAPATTNGNGHGKKK